MAGIKIRKLTAAQFRKELRSYSKEDLAALLEGIYKDCPNAASYLNIRMGGEAYEKALLSEAKEKVRKGFYTNSGNARLIDTTILPYRGILIIDGLVAPMNVMLGGGIKKEFKKIYTSAKQRNQIITSL